MKRLILAGALAALAACGDGGDPINTPSGHPEVTLRNVNADCVRSSMQSSAMSAGSLVRVSTPSMLVVGKPTKSFAAAMLIGSRLNPVPEERATVMYAQMGNDLHIVVQISWVTNPGTGLESSLPGGSGKDAATLMVLAERIAVNCRRG